MGNQNSLVEFYLNVYMRLHSDVVGAHASSSDVDYERDRKEICNRVRSEGLGFFTKTLPRFGKAIDKALSNGDCLQSSGFKLKSGTQLPVFYRMLVKQVFDDTGRERSDACPMALKQLRQLLFVLYKLELPYDEDTANNKIREFVETDKNLDYLPGSFDERELSILLSARDIVARVMSGICPRLIEPKHGPGAVATGERNHQKRRFSRMVESIEEVYPFTEYYRFNLSHVADSIEEITSLQSVSSGTAKVVLVPKDSRGPRIISCEPLENQWIQQGQMTAIVRRLESYALTRGHVNFADQEINRRLAMQSSMDGLLCTLDMKEASDRVSLDLVQHLFPKNWFEALYASRSDSTKLPDGTVVPLNKFAPMGSAVCFPVEALVFWALCVSVVMHTRTGGSLARAREHTYVYGDDIICSCDDQAAIRHYLPRFGLLLNEDKCCTQGSFRESCGCDAYKGIDVTPLKFSAVWSHRLTAGSYESYVSYSNELYGRGYYETAKYLESLIQKVRPTPYTNGELAQGICFVRDDVTSRQANRNANIKVRFNKNLHRMEARGWRSRPSHIETADLGWDELLRVASSKGDKEVIPSTTDPTKRLVNTWFFIWNLVNAQKEHDQRQLKGHLGISPESVRAGLYAVPRSNRLQRGWIAVE